jgi:hypothetical protein
MMSQLKRIIPRITGIRTGSMSYSSKFFRPYSSLSNGKQSVLFNPEHLLDEKVAIVEKDCPKVFFDRTQQQLDHIPTHPILTLPILDSMVQRVLANLNLGDLQHTVIVGAQHILETTASLFNAVIKTGVPPENIWAIGKIYSTSLPVAKTVMKLGINLMDDAIPKTPDGYNKANRLAIQNMFNKLGGFIKEKGIKKIIVLDDGGRVIELTPEDFRTNFHVAAIEQTRGGLYSPGVHSFLSPLIPVAQAAIKTRFLEPLMIAKALFRTEKAIKSLGLSKDKVCGVIGNGAIGGALVDYFLKNGFTVIAYDQSSEAFKGLNGKNLCRVSRVEEVIANASFIFGCSGQDVTRGIDIFSLADRDKVLVSTTSEQKEFFTWLQVMTMILHRDSGDQSTNFNPLGDMICTNSNGRSITIKNMGYPFNFPIVDSAGDWVQPWNVPAHHIELTQCAMYAAFVQATLSAAKPVFDGVTINRAKMHSLNPYMQRYIALSWWMREGHEFCNLYPQSKVDFFKSIQWIQDNSGGLPKENSELKACFEYLPKALEQNSRVTIEEIQETEEKPTHHHDL